ncbi:MAG TPA: CoA-binding protein [Candidatus Uhrbacteria bacterium]|nr:CoA-binding protein [Candidatus Uhrbacteria bacterium]
MEQEILDKFINSDFIYAIAGATQNHEKYGYKVLIDLKNKGYNVIPINPNYNEISGLKCYPDLISLDDRPDVVVLVVGEKNAQKIVQDCVELNLNRIWFQPGSEYDQAVKMAKTAGFEIMVGECIMQLS